MKDLVKNSSVCGYLEKIFISLNQDRFGGFLETPIITVQSSSRSYGYITCERLWEYSDGSNLNQYELNISSEWLGRSIENVVSTMLHEMVHLYHLMNNIQDTSRGCTYHNKAFKSKAEEVGLVIDYDPRVGWAITSPGEELIDYVHKKKWKDILISRNTGTDGLSIRRPSSTRKYQCPCCGMSVRATKEVRIICADCSELLRLCK